MGGPRKTLKNLGHTPRKGKVRSRAQFRCLGCKNFDRGSPERCSHISASSPKVRLRKLSSAPNSYELFSDEMGSNGKGEINCNIYSEERETVSMSKKSVFSGQRNGTGTPIKQNPQTPEYVKRTAKLFETVQTTENVKNGDSETFCSNEADPRKTETIRISLDCLDGEYNKKPSYVGVSCSNSGYRNVINYNSKLREGFWSANNQRESLVLSSSRLRDSSPLRRDFDFKSHNGWSRDSVKVSDVRIEKEAAAPVNGVTPEKFVNISTSTKTISTFRNSKDVKAEEMEKAVNGGTRHSDGGCRGESKVNLKQILNSKNNEPYRKGYTNLGFSPKILKSPEKNCNSFLKSISSFENNCKKSSQPVKSTTYTKAEQRAYDSSNSIQQRIERLYGPGALAQGFYTQKTQPKTDALDKSSDAFSDGKTDIPPQNKSQTPVTTTVNSITKSNKSSKATVLEAAPTENYPNGHSTLELIPEPENDERSGHYFLRLLKKETDRLEQLASFAESELENGENLPEEISGKLRAAAGKARLLVCQKLHQFEGLCHKNLNEKPEEQFPTTSEDLAGFWDMVMLQVVQVCGVFDELEELKKNNWKALPAKKESPSSTVTNGRSPQTKTSPKKSTPSSGSAEKQMSDSAKKAREEGRRKLLEERRKKMKELKENKIISADNEVEIFAK